MDRLSGILSFVRAAELRSFAQASRMLGVTASGVGKSVSRLEAELGVRLLSRTTRRVSLTDDGAVFFERCRRLLDDLESAQNLIAERGAAPRGRLRASVPIAFGRRTIVPQLPAFLERYPDVTLELNLADRRVNLVDDGIDVAVRIGNLNDSSLVARRIGVQQIITIAPARSRDGRAIATLGELTQGRCVVYRLPATGKDRPWYFMLDGRTVELRPKPYLTVDEGESMVAAVAAGMGATQVPGYMAEDALARGEVVEVLRELRPPPDPINAIYLSGRNLPARTRAFVDFLAGMSTQQARPAPRRGTRR
jgi:DNA-binding transcriptional LysR family regulator